MRRQAQREIIAAMQVIRMALKENRLASMVIWDAVVIEAIEITGRDWAATGMMPNGEVRFEKHKPGRSGT